MRNHKEFMWVIGYIDSYGAIHSKFIEFKDKYTSPNHNYYWPTQHHKLWRFNSHGWDLSNSVLGKDRLTPEDADKVMEFLRTKLIPPEWVLHGEAWEAAGRPRGKAQDKFEREYQKKKLKRVDSIK